MKKSLFLFILAVLSILQISAQSDHQPANTFSSGTSGAADVLTEYWQLIPSGTSEQLNTIHFGSASTGYIGGNLATCLKTTNGGFDWIPLIVPSYVDFYSIWATSANEVHVGAWDTIYNSVNGGASWSPSYTNTVNYYMMDLQFHNTTLGYAFLQASAFIKTTNGGSSWSELTGCGVIDDFLAGQMVDQNTGFAVGRTSIIGKTTDGGNTWTQYDWNGWTEWTPIDIEGVYFTSTLKGIAVADSGVIFRTTDGGTSWVRSSIAGPEDQLTDVWFTDANHGWIVGYHGLIFSTTDGGESWIQEPVLTSNDLNSVFFISNTLGWAVGSNGTILRYGSPAGTGFADPASVPGNIRLYPNPAENYATISFEPVRSQEACIELFDAAGRLISTVYRGKLKEGLNDIRINRLNLSAGTYQCRVSLQEGCFHQTIVFQ